MVSKLSEKCFSPQDLHIIPIQSLNSFAIQFWDKHYFCYFLVIGLKGERERS
jgi:hypothetical protein